MELRHLFNLIGKWMWLVALSVAVAATSSFFASRAATPLYATKTTLVVGRVIQNPNPNSVDLYTGQQLAHTYAQLARREPVLQGALQELGLKMSWSALAERVSANVIVNTQLLEIHVIDSDPLRARALADAIAEQLILQTPAANRSEEAESAAFTQSQISDLKEKIEAGQKKSLQLKQELEAATSARQVQSLQSQADLLDTKISNWQATYSQLLATLQGGNTNVLTVVEAAALPTSPISPNLGMNVLMAAAIGLILALGGAFLVEYLDDTIKTPEDVERVTNLATLGAIARIEGDAYGDKLIAARQPLSPIVEAYRVIRTNLQFSSVDKPVKTLLLSSPSPSEGKSITIANLAVVMAQAGLRVVIVDADLRRPVQHRIFDLPNRQGLSNAIVSSERSVKEYLQPTLVENLCLLSSGALPPNPAELIGSIRLKEILEELKEGTDMLLLDSPPVLAVADTLILAGQVDGVILVNDSGGTRTNEARRAAAELQRARANVLGVVLNHFRSSPRGYYHSYETESRKRLHRSGRTMIGE